MIDTSLSLDELNSRNKNSLAENLGIEFTEVTPNYLKATMPVDNRTTQPLGLLHGGASAALAESVGSMASYISVDRDKYYCVGLEIKCNHVRSATEGSVTATAKPLHTGRRFHVWNIQIDNAEGKPVCFSTLTMAIMPVDDKSKIPPEKLMKKTD